MLVKSRSIYIKPRPKWSSAHSTYIANYISPEKILLFCDICDFVAYRPQPTRRTRWETSWQLVASLASCKPGRFLHSTCAASFQPACRDRSVRLPTCWQPKKVAI